MHEYSYKFLETLVQEIPKKQYSHVEQAYIYAYKVHTSDAKYPFLECLLTNSLAQASLSFPEVFFLQKYPTPGDLVSHCQEYLSSLGKSVFHGYHCISKKCLVLCFELPVISSKGTFALPYEILVDEAVEGCPISRFTSDFFLYSKDRCHLYPYNEEEEEDSPPYELPRALYVPAKDVDTLELIHQFGQLRADDIPFLGPHSGFLFVSKCAAPYVRFAVFLGSTRFLKEGECLTLSTEESIGVAQKGIYVVFHYEQFVSLTMQTGSL